MLLIYSLWTFQTVGFFIDSIHFTRLIFDGVNLFYSNISNNKLLARFKVLVSMCKALNNSLITEIYWSNAVNLPMCEWGPNDIYEKLSIYHSWNALLIEIFQALLLPIFRCLWITYCYNNQFSGITFMWVSSSLCFSFLLLYLPYVVVLYLLYTAYMFSVWVRGLYFYK